MSEFIVDASVAAKWFFHEPHAENALELLAETSDLIAPDLLRVEFANIVWNRSKRNQVSPDQVDSLLADFLGLPIQFIASTTLVAPALSLAVELRQTVYDCLYLATAIERGCELITGDERFLRALPAPLKGHARWIGTYR